MALYYARSSLSAARVVILGVPYDRTSSFMPGSRFAPQAVRTAADNIESYSPSFGRDLEDIPICDAGDLAFPDSTWPGVSEMIEARLAELFHAGQVPVALGGEHSVTGPIVAAASNQFPELCVVQFDAHADLRAEFLGDRFSHATVMHHCIERLGPERVFQYGIRSGTRAEFAQARHLHPFEVLAPLRQTRSLFAHRPVYLTIDLDVLDPGVLPATATPEPGGISYTELRAALVELCGIRIVGLDLVEFNPLAGRDLASAALVAALLREAILAAVSGPTPGRPSS